MGKLRFTLTSLLLWPIMAIAIFLVTNLNFLKTESFPFFDITSFALITFLVIGLLVFYFILEHKQNKFKVHYLFFPIILMLSILFIAIIWVQPVETFVGPYGEITINPTNYKIYYSIEVVIIMLVLYIILFMYSRKQINPKTVSWLNKAFVLFTLGALIVGIFMHIPNLKLLFDAESNLSSTYKGLTSIFYNENAFAMCLLIAILAIFTLNCNKRRWYWYVLISLFYIAIFLTTSVTCIYLSTLGILLFGIYDLIKLTKQKFGLGLAMIIINVTLMFGLIFGIILVLNTEVKYFTKIFEYFFKEITGKDFTTFTNRTDIWKLAWEQLVATNPIYILFGRGLGLSTYYTNGLLSVTYSTSTYADSMHSTHSGYLDIILGSGIFGVSLYGIAILYFIGCSIYLIVKKKGEFATPNLICVFIVLSHSFFESNSFFSFNYFSILQTLMFFLPTLNYARNVKKQGLTKGLIKEDHQLFQMDRRRVTTFISSVFLFVSFITGICYLSALINGGESTSQHIFRLFSFLLMAASAIAFLFVPGVIANMYYGKTKRRFIVYLILFFGCLALVAFSSSLTVDLFRKYLNINLIRIVTVFASCSTYLLIAFIISMVSNKYNLSKYLKDLFITTFNLNVWPFTIGAIISIILFIGLSLSLKLNFYSNLALIVMVAATYLITFFAQKHDIKSYYVYYFNEQSLARLSKLAK